MRSFRNIGPCGPRIGFGSAAGVLRGGWRGLQREGPQVSLIGGASFPSFTVSGDLFGVGVIDGAASLDLVASGDIFGVGVVDGASAFTLVTTGDIFGVGLIDGATTYTLTTVGDIFGVGVIDGAAAYALTTAGSLLASNLESWIDPSVDASIDNPGGAVTYAIDQSRDLADVVTDGDMELGGVANWTALAGIVATKDVTSPHSGSQALRLTSTGAGLLGCFQTNMTVGKRYRIHGWGRGDGTAVPKMRDRGGLEMWVGTTSTSWQQFVAVFDPGHAGLRPSGQYTGGGEWVEWDDLEMFPSNDAYQGTGARRPTHNQSTDSIDYVAASTQFMEWMIPNSTAGTLIIWTKTVDHTVDLTQVGGNDGADFCNIKTDTNNWMADIGTTADWDSGVTAADDTWTMLTLTWDGTDESFTVNTTRATASNADTPTTKALYLGATNNNGAAADHWDGSHGNARLWSRALSEAEITAYFNATKADYGL